VTAGIELENGVEFLRRSMRVFTVTLLCATEMPDGEAEPEGEDGRGCRYFEPITVWGRRSLGESRLHREDHSCVTEPSMATQE
jgi:hypothetical protein